MKFTVPLFSPLVVVEAFVVASTAELTGPLRPQVLKTLTPQYNLSATRAVYMYGPLRLQSSTAKHAPPSINGLGIKLDPNSDTLSENIEAPCKDCTVHNAVASFAFQDGKPADTRTGVYQHHLIIVDFSGKLQLTPPVKPPQCSNGFKIAPLPLDLIKSGKAGHMRGFLESRSMFQKRQFGFSFFLGGGGSMGSGLPFSPKPGASIKSGYYIARGGSMQLSSELVNYDPVDKELYLTIDLEWSPGKDPNMFDVGNGAITADNCNDKEQAVHQPPIDRPITYKGEPWNVLDDGYLLNFLPHLHDGGIGIKVYVNDRVVCESTAIYGDEGTTNTLDGKKWQTITGYTPCEQPVQIKKGDKVSMSSEYDLTKYRLRPDNAHVDGEAEAMSLAQFQFVKPFPKGNSGRS